MTWSAESEVSSQNERGNSSPGSSTRTCTTRRVRDQDPARYGSAASQNPGPWLVPFIGPAGQQGLPGQRVNSRQGQALQYRVVAHAGNVVRAPGLQRRHQLLPGIPGVETDHRLLAEEPLRPVQGTPAMKPSPPSAVCAAPLRSRTSRRSSVSPTDATRGW